eukprot:TRINITY_DN7744_c0_g1_i13.p2 TRINITY_DN7744_c0_g1~~TRINITY_DN7744_c0_g1_i13.p2  ORF type:complete len:439 (+),score=52.45 TRINITY_DN7744_c0_g1_i13:2690-4006(+)
MLECERLKDLVGGLESRDPNTLTDAFWAQAEDSMSIAKVLSSKSPHSSFASCKAVVPSSFIEESQRTRQPSRFISTTLTCAQTAKVQRKVLCACAHLDDSSILYTGCASGEVLQVTLPCGKRDVSAIEVLSTSHVYAVTHVLCCRIRERDVPFEDVFVVSGGFDKTVRIMNITKGRVYRVLQYHRGAMSAMCCWGGQLITAGHEGALLVWDITRRTCESLLACSDEGRVVTSLLAEGQLLVIGYQSGVVRVYVSPNAAALNSAEGPPPLRLCFKFLASAPIRRDIPMQFLPPSSDGLRGHKGDVTAVALRDDMSTLFTGGADTHVIKWMLQKKDQAWKVKAHAASVNYVLPIGLSLLATSADDGLLKLWDEDNMLPIRVMSPHYSVVTCLLRVSTKDAGMSFSEKRTKRDPWPTVITTCEDCIDTWVFGSDRQQAFYN